MEEKNINEVNELDQLKQKNDEYLNGWKRERADFINYKKDEMERINGLIKYANEEIILNFLPILDNVILAESHLKDEGISQIKKQFLELLKKEGIEPIECMGKPFDANTMEIIGEVEGGESGVVAEESQMGFTLHGKLIRPSKVKIAK